MVGCKLLLLLPLALVQSWDWKQNGDNWGGTCDSGTKQSPIDITDTTDVDDGSLEFVLDTSAKSATLQSYQLFRQWKPEDGGQYGTLTKKADGQSDVVYIVDAIHFHAPSEHKIDGKQYDLELHIYASNQSTTASDMIGLAVFFDSDDDDENDFLTTVQGIKDNNAADSLDPKDAIGGETKIQNFYYYQGSYTAPDCNENISWVVVKDVQDMSDDQKDWWDNLVISTYGDTRNVRNTQDLNGRTVWLYDEDWSSFLGLGALLFIGLV